MSSFQDSVCLLVCLPSIVCTCLEAIRFCWRKHLGFQTYAEEVFGPEKEKLPPKRFCHMVNRITIGYTWVHDGTWIWFVVYHRKVLFSDQNDGFQDTVQTPVVPKKVSTALSHYYFTNWRSLILWKGPLTIQRRSQRIARFMYIIIYICMINICLHLLYMDWADQLCFYSAFQG